MTCQRASEIDLAAFLVEPDLPEWEGFRAHYPECSDCAAAVAAFTRLESALRAPVAGAAGAAHPEPARLARFAADPSALGAEATALSAHLAGCARCRTELRALQGFDWRRIAESADAPRGRDPRSLGERLAAWLGLGSPRLLAPVALAVCALIGFGLWLGVRSTRAPEHSAPPPTAAQAPSAPAIPGAADAPTGALAKREPEAAAPTPSASEGSAEASEATRQAVRSEAPSPSPTPERVPAPQPDAAAGLDGIQLAALAELPPPAYVQPAGVEALAGASEPSVVRGGGAAPAVALQVQAPRHAGQTAQASPRLWWSLAEPSDRPLLFTLTDGRSIEPVLRLELPGPHPRGLGSLDLKQSGVELEPGVVYRWFVTLTIDPAEPSRNPVSAAAIVRIAPDDPRADLAGIAPAQRGHELARRGLWYDANDFFAELAAAHPEQRAMLERHRALLLSPAGTPR